MKIVMLLSAVMLIAAPTFARAAVRPSSSQLFRKEQGGGVINLPLTDHMRNGKTDLQWFAKVSVGTPPQEL